MSDLAQAPARARALPHFGDLRLEKDDMRSDDWQLLYQHLRRELDMAYAERPWDGGRIDRIAEDLLHLERSPGLAARPVPNAR